MTETTVHNVVPGNSSSKPDQTGSDGKCVKQLKMLNLFIYILNKKETSHTFLHAIQQKGTLLRYCQACLLCDRYQATRCTNSVLISNNCRRVSPIRLNAQNHIENVKCACASSLLFTWSSSGYYHQSDSL